MMELLAPAGCWDAMAAAVQNGADAVYLGCGAWNARRSAKNFTEEELPEAVRYCHLRGVKVYLTLNTLLSDRELPQAASVLRRASQCGVDAVIVQDWGLASLARQIVPDLPLHGSTQMTVHTLAGVEAAAALGMQCVVLSRELDRENIRYICKKSPVKIEVFGHGALCMCWSGQCAMSALIGGRSGNRGLCAQPCRLPYRIDGGKTGRPLSLKDASLANHIPELLEMGVSVLKLEGRMKRAEYVAVVTRIYAALIREKRAPTPEEMHQLAMAFSRDGFTDGYWLGKTGPHMFGSRPENAPEPAELFRDAQASYTQKERRTVPITVFAEIRTGRPARVTVTGGPAAAVEGPVPEPARTRPLTAEELRDRLSKTGGTVFRAEEVSVTVDSGLSLSASAVNGLRRAALDKLAELRTAPPVRRELPDPPPVDAGEGSPSMALTVSLSRGAQLTPALLDLSPAIVYFPVERVGEFDLSTKSVSFCAVLPRACKDSELPALAVLLRQAQEKGCSTVMVQNIGQCKIAEGFSQRGGFALNVFNSRSLLELRSWGLVSAMLSFELRYQQIRSLRKPLPCEALIYGRLPLMLTENCLPANALACRNRDLSGACRKPHTLAGRRGEGFPILSVFGCRSEIENSQVLYLADKTDHLRCGLAYGCLRFTSETPEECAAVLRAYREGGGTPETFTRGLFYRGVE